MQKHVYFWYRRMLTLLAQVPGFCTHMLPLLDLQTDFASIGNEMLARAVSALLCCLIDTTNDGALVSVNNSVRHCEIHHVP